MLVKEGHSLQTRLLPRERLVGLKESIRAFPTNTDITCENLMAVNLIQYSVVKVHETIQPSRRSSNRTSPKASSSGPRTRRWEISLQQQELIEAIRSLANGKAVGPDGDPIELFKIALNGDPALRQRLLDIVVGI